MKPAIIVLSGHSAYAHNAINALHRGRMHDAPMIAMHSCYGSVVDSIDVGKNTRKKRGI